jgi:catechol 2,3-dioxygenase-like lactoylglutathione lyase family enzyme
VIDFSGLFHSGVLVPDIHEAMAQYSATLGLQWAQLQEREQSVWLPGVGETTIPLKFTYSMAGPHHIELLQGAPGSIWDGVANPGLHHYGVWVDDVGAVTEAAVANGWTLAFAGKAPEDGYGSFTYVIAPHGLIVEPVTSAAKPMFERWWAGGKLG